MLDHDIHICCIVPYPFTLRYKIYPPTFPSIPLDPRNQFPTYETQILALRGIHRGSLSLLGGKKEEKKKKKNLNLLFSSPPLREGEAIGFAAKGREQEEEEEGGRGW